jgi:hypothetical protein
MDVIYLPATEPDDDTFGHPPGPFADMPSIRVFEVSYSRMVWYNEEIRVEEIQQIEAMPADQYVLVGFSKSGSGRGTWPGPCPSGLPPPSSLTRLWRWSQCQTSGVWARSMVTPKRGGGICRCTALPSSSVASVPVTDSC